LYKTLSGTGSTTRTITIQLTSGKHCDIVQHIPIHYYRGDTMSVRKRLWTTSKNEQREAWIVDYTDQHGDRHLETFARKKDADSRHAEVRVDVKAGIHIAPSKSITVTDAGESWLKASEAHGLERATIKQYREHLYQHIVPLIGRMKLPEISAQTVRKFEDKLREQGRSPAMVRKIIGSLGSVLADAQEQGLAAHNAVRDLRRNRRRGKDGRVEKRQKGKLKVGVDIPTPDEISTILSHATGRWRPFLVTAIFTGLRASELRGLRWSDVNLKAGKLHVQQRADRFYEIGRPKSEHSEREVPFGKFVANTLKEWKLACPKNELDLVFPTSKGKVADHANIIRDGFAKAQIAAGITKDGKPKYTGLHALRHFYASWCINRTKDGGLGLPPKNVQERLGHSSITITLDTYGHLFKGDDAQEIDAAEQALVARSAT
jgi:integrase